MIFQKDSVTEITTILSAPIGASVCYHIGYLAADRAFSEEVNDTGKLAWKLYEQGRVCLTQKRLEKNKPVFAYLATRI